ncbi:MAG: multidrug effflux MFS transporter [Selenomonas sp.]|jgi:DHA1 family bicyclomycin/chloramphenicol resistance-like MFS transporter|uniref:Bcr/CflA family efflux transporter n=1 Tax=Selenomonas ruminantium TaxID=971 RepID=A0A927ZSB9_SELRU|nr:multidrug effflux MFS transporter [Selenomonas ruminantium]MBO5649952.1 multidrug effflux MFS transporter [Selenomonas sp.]
MAMTKGKQLWLTVFLGLMTAMAPLATDMYLPALPTMQGELNISASLAQMTLTMTMIGMALGQIFAGPVSDRYGRKRPLVLGMMVFTLSTVGCVWAENIVVFLFFRFVMGFAGASGIVIAKAIARDLCEGPELTRFFAMLMMVNGLAPIIAPVLGGQILLVTSWRGVFVVLVGVGIVQLLATLAYQETLPEKERKQGVLASFATFPQLFRNRYFMGNCLVQCFVFGSFFAYLAGSSFVFQNIFKVSPQMYSLIFGGMGAGLLVAGMLPARLAGRVADVKMLHVSILISLAGSVLLLGGFYGKLGMAVIVSLLFMTIVPLSVVGAASFSLALSKQGKNAGSASALIGFFSMILGGCMMPLVGIAGENTAMPMCIIMLFGYIFGYAAYKFMIEPEHRG